MEAVWVPGGWAPGEGLMTSRLLRARKFVAGVALVSGIVGFVLASGVSFTASRGVLVGSLMSFNRLGAMVTIVLSLAALAGCLSGSDLLAAAAGGGFLAAALLQLVQAGSEPNFLGGRPSTFSFFLMIGIGLLALTYPPDALEGTDPK